MPVQRIPRLKLMLEELLKNTWKEHEDYEDLVAASKRVAEVAEYVETAQHKVSQICCLKQTLDCNLY
jgi:hypothetical protein